METILLPASNPRSLRQALERLARGELVAFPTDTVYGLGAALDNPRSIAQLYEVKGRDATKAIPVLVGNIDDLSRVTTALPPIARQLAKQFWPGPLTLVVPRRTDLPAILSPYVTIGVRMPDHPVALALLRAAGPLAVTSANLSDQPSTTQAHQVWQSLHGRIPLILDGGTTPGGVASTVVDCTQEEPVVLRPGPLSAEEILHALE